MKQNTEPLKGRHIAPPRGLLLALLVWAVWLSSCSRGPEAIPDDVMRNIMRDALISQAIISNDDDKILSKRDSLDLHTRIIDRYDYTMDDFRFTIREMSIRKSNPLSQILKGVVGDMKSASDFAEVRYLAHLSADSVAQAHTCDTVFRSDTILHGKLDDYKIVYSGLVPEDSVVLQGSYRLIFDYSTGLHARSYTKSISIEQTADEGRVIKKTMWITAAKDTSHYSEDIKVGYGIKQLEISLNEKPQRSSKPDTCYLTGIRLVHVLPIKQARRLFLQQLTGIEPIKELYEKRYLDSLKKRSGPTPPYAHGFVTPQCSDSVRFPRDSSEHRTVR